MIIQLFVFGLFFLGFGIFALLKRKKFIGWMFILMGLMINTVGIIAVSLYPHLLPF